MKIKSVLFIGSFIIQDSEKEMSAGLLVSCLIDLVGSKILKKCNANAKPC